MSTAARKARKRANIPFERKPKVPTGHYQPKGERRSSGVDLDMTRISRILARFGGSWIGRSR